jgi:hypothetical protein
MSSALLAKTTPVRPPTVKRNRKPRTHNIEAERFIGDPCSLAIHEKILMPVGIAMIMVAAVK